MPDQGDENNINIRWVPEGVSRALTNQLKQMDQYISQAPTLEMVYRGGEKDGQAVVLTPGKEYMVGREQGAEIYCDKAAVSRVHARVFYDNEHGWMVKEYPKPSTSGTWMHPKTYLKARHTKQNSLPVLIKEGMVIKAHTYTFQINFIE